MLRVTLISLVVLPLLFWFAFQAKQKNQPLLSVGLLTAAAMYVLLLIGGFFGVVGG